MWNDTSIIRDNSDEQLSRRIITHFRRGISEKYYRGKINESIRKTLDGVPFSIFSNNCMGGVFYHDAGRQFTSPTINMAIDGEDFIRFLENPQHYLGIRKFEFVEYPDLQYPVAHLDDIEIRFVHYKTQEECEEKWRSRAERIDWEHLFIIGTDRDGLYKPELLNRFDKLPYKHKLLFTAKNYPEYPWAVQIPQFKRQEQVRIVSYYADFKGHRYYDTCFDIAGWIKKTFTEEHL